MSPKGDGGCCGGKGHGQGGGKGKDGGCGGHGHGKGKDGGCCGGKGQGDCDKPDGQDDQPDEDTDPQGD